MRPYGQHESKSGGIHLGLDYVCATGGIAYPIRGQEKRVAVGLQKDRVVFPFLQSGYQER